MTVADILGYMQDNAALVNAHKGAAFAEVEILKQLAEGTVSGAAGIMGDIHLKKMQRGVPIVSDRAKAYEFTHDVFMASDFGREPMPGIDQSGYEAKVEELVVEYASDFDVLCELLMVAKCLGYWSVNLTTALTSFTNNMNIVSQSSEDFAENYHLLLVGGLLYTMLE